jgi:hypothetical protein
MKIKLLGVSLISLILAGCGGSTLKTSTSSSVSERTRDDKLPTPYSAEDGIDIQLPYAEYENFKTAYKDLLAPFPKKTVGSLTLLEREERNYDKRLKYIFSAVDSGAMSTSIASLFSDQVSKAPKAVVSTLFPALDVSGDMDITVSLQKDRLKETIKSFFKENLLKGSPQDSIFFQGAFGASDKSEDKMSKRDLLQQEFKSRFDHLIVLTTRGKEKGGSQLKEFSINYADVIDNLINTSAARPWANTLEDLKTKLIPFIYNVNQNRGSTPPTIILPENENKSKLPMDLSLILEIIVPQGGNTDKEIESVKSLLEAQKLKEFVGKDFHRPMSARLASDIISTRDSRSYEGQVNLSQLTLEGNTGRAWTLDQALYVSAKGTVENKTTDNLNGVVSYNFNGFTLGSTYAFENSKEVSNYAGSVLASKSFASNLFVEFQSGFEKEGASVLSTQKYTIGADLTFGSPFVQLDHVAGQGARGFVGFDFGSMPIKIEQGAMELTGLIKVNIETGAPVASTGINFATHQGVSLNSTVNLHSELSADVSVEVSR